MLEFTFVKIRSGQGEGEVWKANQPIPYRFYSGEGYEKDTGETQYIWVSAVNVPYSGPETYIFPCNEEGEILDWGELPGSFRGETNIPKALDRMIEAYNNGEFDYDSES